MKLSFLLVWLCRFQDLKKNIYWIIVRKQIQESTESAIRTMLLTNEEIVTQLLPQLTTALSSIQIQIPSHANQLQDQLERTPIEGGLVPSDIEVRWVEKTLLKNFSRQTLP